MKNEIEENYNKLKIEISNIDARLKLLSENANNATIIVDNNLIITSSIKKNAEFLMSLNFSKRFLS